MPAHSASSVVRLPEAVGGLGRCRGGKSFAESAETACSRLRVSAFRAMRRRVDKPGGLSEGGRGSLESEDRRVHLLLTVRSLDLGRFGISSREGCHIPGVGSVTAPVGLAGVAGPLVLCAAACVQMHKHNL